ncbi:MAG: hypothetical protein IJ892_13265, partial [Prevotella sp.]|nr:hypothetical protein [Prevotella sp.]
VSTNPVTGSMDVSFQPGADGTVLIEDVLTLIERAHSEKDRMIVVLDGFQEILDLACCFGGKGNEKLVVI